MHEANRNPVLRDVEILVVDDDPAFREFVCDGLREHGVRCSVVANGTEAITKLQDPAGNPDVMLLDVMMPEVDGWEVLTRVRASGKDISVVFVTAREAVDERVRGLRMGADDYIIKPFAFVELVARIEAVLRRRQGALLRRGNLSLDLLARETRVGATLLNLTAREFDLLHALVSHGGVLSRAELLRRVWHMEHDPETNVVEVHIARVRRKLESGGGPQIVTERGKGYRMAALP